MKTKTKYVGLDVHKDTTVVAVADGGRDSDGARNAEMAQPRAARGVSRTGARAGGQ